MSVTTFRASQTSYAGGSISDGVTRLNDRIKRDLTEFMDAPEVTDTDFLNSISKGPAGTQNKKEWGIKAVNPRGSTVGAGGIDTSATALPVATGHGVRFQLGHILWVEQASTPANYEIMWVNAEPTANGLTVKRAQGGTSGTAFSQHDIIRIIGVALPQLTAYPLSPVSRGNLWYNFYERFQGSIEHDIESRNTADYEIDGDPMDEDMAALGVQMKLNLEQALIVGRRQAGDPASATKEPALVGGILQLAELSGNTTNVASALLSIDHLEEAFSELDDAVGSNAGSRILCSLNTKRVINRLLNNSRMLTATDKTLAQKFDAVELETGTYELGRTRNFPDGKLLIYDPGTVQYHPRKGMDWQEEDLPVTKPSTWRGILGSFTLSVDTPQTMHLIYGFDTTLGNYPSLS